MNRHTADRVAAIGQELIGIHSTLRTDLAALRESMAGAADSEAARIRGPPAHCLAFCSAVRLHHTDEDTSIFPELAASADGRRRPPDLETSDQSDCSARGTS